MYTVPGNCTPLGWQTTEGSPGQTWQVWGGSFLLLPRRHAFSSRWLWTFNHNTCENRLEEVQGSATSPLFTPSLFQNTWPCVQLLCAERNAPCQRDLAIDKAEPPASAAKWQGNDQTDLQCQAARHCHHQVQWSTCAAWHWGSGPHSEGEKTSMVWTCGTLQRCNQDSLWHTGWWKAWAWEAINDMEAADREGLQRVEALGYHDRRTWRSGVRSAMRAASQLSGRGPTDVDVAPVPARLIKNPIMIWRCSKKLRLHFLWIVFLADNSHEMWSLIFLEKYKSFIFSKKAWFSLLKKNTKKKSECCLLHLWLAL